MLRRTLIVYVLLLMIHRLYSEIIDHRLIDVRLAVLIPKHEGSKLLKRAC